MVLSPVEHRMGRVEYSYVLAVVDGCCLARFVCCLFLGFFFLLLGEEIEIMNHLANV